MTACRAAAVGASSTEARGGPSRAWRRATAAANAPARRRPRRPEPDQEKRVGRAKDDRRRCRPSPATSGSAHRRENSWMEVAVDRRVLKTAAGHIFKAAGKPAHKIRERYPIVRAEFFAR